VDAAALAASTLLDLEGRPVRTGELWADRPALAVWLRHYG
jgi:hypothetical protein